MDVTVTLEGKTLQKVTVTEGPDGRWTYTMDQLVRYAPYRTINYTGINPAYSAAGSGISLAMANAADSSAFSSINKMLAYNTGISAYSSISRTWADTVQSAAKTELPYKQRQILQTH